MFLKILVSWNCCLASCNIQEDLDLRSNFSFSHPNSSITLNSLSYLKGEKHRYRVVSNLTVWNVSGIKKMSAIKLISVKIIA